MLLRYNFSHVKAECEMVFIVPEMNPLSSASLKYLGHHFLSS